MNACCVRACVRLLPCLWWQSTSWLRLWRTCGTWTSLWRCWGSIWWGDWRLRNRLRQTEPCLQCPPAEDYTHTSLHWDPHTETTGVCVHALTWLHNQHNPRLSLCSSTDRWVFHPETSLPYSLRTWWFSQHLPSTHTKQTHTQGKISMYFTWLNNSSELESF